MSLAVPTTQAGGDKISIPMTHDTPGDDEAERRWCDRCQLAVEPQPDAETPECPACGSELD